MPGNLISITPELILSWPTPNYVDPARKTWLPAYAWSLYAVVTCGIIARIGYELLFQTNTRSVHPSLDPPSERTLNRRTLLGFAWLCGTAFTITITLACVKYDADRHAWDVPPSAYVKIVLMAWLSELSFLLTNGCTKVCVLLYYNSQIGGASRVFKPVIFLTIFFIVAYTAAFVLLLFFNCRPLHAYWTAFDFSSTEDYTCIDTKNVNLLAGAFAIISDFCWIAIPPAWIWMLRPVPKQTVALIFITIGGIVVVVASGFRTIHLYSELPFRE